MTKGLGASTCLRAASAMSLGACAVTLTFPSAAAGQSPSTGGEPGPSARVAALQNVELSADSVEIGDQFDLRFTVTLGEDAVVLLPDSLQGRGFAPVGPVEWSIAEEEEGARRTLSISYPLIAFRTGALAIPEIDVFFVPTSEAMAADVARPGDVVGSWEAFREEPAATPGAFVAVVPEQRVTVSTVLALDDLTTRIAPRPAADVWGGDRHWPSTLLLALSGLLLTGVMIASAREWAEARASGASPPPSARDRALTALDQLMAEDLHREGRVRELYAGWSEIVRRYVEDFDDAWDPSWTSTELFADLQGPRRNLAIRRSLSPEGISREVRIAEEVKFGGLRPVPETAERHWQAVRSWLEGSREAES